MIRDFVIAFAAGLAFGLVALLFKAHLLLALIVGLLVCVTVIAWLERGLVLHRTPLRVKVRERRWDNWRNFALIGAFRVEITNTTALPIRISSIVFTVDGPWTPWAVGDDNGAADRESRERTESHRYGPPLLIHSEVPARRSISGWYVTAISRNPQGGTPNCKLIIKDGLGNRYTALVPAQTPKAYS